MRIQPTGSLVIDGKPQPANTTLMGYAALIKTLNLPVPMPKTVSVVGEGKHRSDPGRNYALKDGYAVFERNYAVEPDFGSHLTFALRHERLDLLALKRIFLAVAPEEVARFVAEAPTTGYRRQAWFFYEWLTGRTINPVEAGTPIGNYVDAIDPKRWHTGPATRSPRHRIVNNLPGTPAFCPMMPRDVPLVEDLAEVAVTRLRAAAGDAGEARLRRLGRRLLLKDSKSTFLIENETPSLTMAQRWGEEIAKAGSVPLDLVLMTRLQKLLMSERRFMVTGLRRAGVFLGDRIDNSPAPVWIGARPEDLQNLMDGLVETNRRMAEGSIHPVVQAAITAFGMVLIHPFEDGNGRLHRYLLQHVLGERGVAPCSVALPLSKAIWNDIEGYVEALESCQTDRLGLIEWKPTANGNVDVTNDTADLYRYFDASVHGRFLMKCIDRVFERDIPQEFTEMDRRDRVVKGVRDILDMPDTMVDKFIQFMLQNDGKLSKAKRTKEFSQLTDEEVVAMQDLVRETYEIADAPSADLPTP
jgi:hypothetical protein